MAEKQVLTTSEYLDGRLRWLLNRRQELANEIVKLDGSIEEIRSFQSVMTAAPATPAASVTNRAARRRTKGS